MTGLQNIADIDINTEQTTAWHKQWQEQFAETQCEVTVCSSESNTYRRADVMTDDLVVEFQHSSISQDELYDRTAFYKKLGKTVWWVFDRTNKAVTELRNKNYNIGSTRFLKHIIRPLAANKVNSVFLDYDRCIVWLWNLDYNSNTAKGCYIISKAMFVDLIKYKAHKGDWQGNYTDNFPYNLVENYTGFYKNLMLDACVAASSGCVNIFSIENLFDKLGQTVVCNDIRCNNKKYPVKRHYLSIITIDDMGNEFPTVAHFQQSLSMACDKSELNAIERYQYQNYLRNTHIITLADICREVIIMGYI